MEWDAQSIMRTPRTEKAKDFSQELESKFEEVDFPCVITDRFGRIITWHLPGLLDKGLVVIIYHWRNRISFWDVNRGNSMKPQSSFCHWCRQSENQLLPALRGEQIAICLYHQKQGTWSRGVLTFPPLGLPKDTRWGSGWELIFDYFLIFFFQTTRDQKIYCCHHEQWRTHAFQNG